MYFCVQTLIFVHYRINGISTGIKEFKNLNACGYKNQIIGNCLRPQ